MNRGEFVREERFMKMAVDIALENVMTEHGGPFGAIIVRKGKIIGIGRNEVTATNDPTAHAEMQAIRAACKELNSYQLTDCEIYTSCEPCPMCFGAIYWARLTSIYYACTKTEAAGIGFDDQFIYEQLALRFEERAIPMKQVQPENYTMPFKIWKTSINKAEY